MSEQSTGGVEQTTLDGGEAAHVECEYYDGCESAALYIDEILHYGEGEKPVKMCESCADEHTVPEGNEVQRLKPEDRYVREESDTGTVWVVASRKEDLPHPYVEAVYDNEEAAKEHKNELAENSFQHGVVAWGIFDRSVDTDTDRPGDDQ